MDEDENVDSRKEIESRGEVGDTRHVRRTSRGKEWVH